MNVQLGRRDAGIANVIQHYSVGTKLENLESSFGGYFK